MGLELRYLFSRLRYCLIGSGGIRPLTQHALCSQMTQRGRSLNHVRTICRRLLPPSTVLLLLLLSCSSCAHDQWLEHQTDEQAPHAIVIVVPLARKADWLLVDPQPVPDASVVTVYSIDGRCVPDRKTTYRLSPGCHQIVYQETSLDPSAGMIGGVIDALNNIKGSTISQEDWRYQDPANGRSLRTVYTNRPIELDAGKTYIFEGAAIRQETAHGQVVSSRQ